MPTPSRAPDGRILFTSERAATFGIQATDLGGARRTALGRLPGAESLPEWSPGRGPASRSCPSGRAGPPHLRAGDGLRRARPRQLTQAPGFDDTYPAWAPGGRRIAFVREDQFGTDYLYTTNADGTGVRFLLEAPDLCCPEWSHRRDAPCPRAELGDRRRGPKRAGTPTRHGRGAAAPRRRGRRTVAGSPSRPTVTTKTTGTSSSWKRAAGLRGS